MCVCNQPHINILEETSLTTRHYTGLELLCAVFTSVLATWPKWRLVEACFHNAWWLDTRITRVPYVFLTMESVHVYCSSWNGTHICFVIEILTMIYLKKKTKKQQPQISAIAAMHTLNCVLWKLALFSILEKSAGHGEPTDFAFKETQKKIAVIGGLIWLKREKTTFNVAQISKRKATWFVFTGN